MRPATLVDPRPVAPAAFAAVVVIVAGLLAATAGVASGLVASGLGSALLARGAGRRARAWSWVACLVGLRTVLATAAGLTDRADWDRRARDGSVHPIEAVVRLETARPGRGERWSLRGVAEACDRPCRGATLTWSWRAEESDPAPTVGERWHISGRLTHDPVRHAPGARFPPAGLAPGSRRGRISDVAVGGRQPVAVPALFTLREHIERRIDARFGSDLAPLATAMLLGDRRRLDPGLVDAFAITGTLHLLAVSGLHVGFLAGLLGFGLGLAGVSPARRAAAATVVLVVYAALVGGRPSVMRATAMAAAILWSRAGERRTSVWHAWGAAAVAILAWRPTELFGLGFALSFAAVAGLLATGGALRAALEGRAGSGGHARRSGTGRVTGLLTGGLVATTAATAGTVPIQAAAFGWLAPAGFLLNPLAVPLAGIALPLAWLALAADAAGLAPLADPMSAAARTALGGLAALVATAGARAPIWVPGPAGWGFGAAGIFGLAAMLGRRSAPLGMLVAGIGFGLLLAAGPPRAAGWEIAWLDVGQGDAVVIHFPDGATWLVDAGGADPYGDAARRVILPYLRRRGIRSLAWLVTTHPDLDHIGGAESLLRGIDVVRWGSAGPVAAGEAWLRLLATPGAEARLLRAGTRLSQGGVAISVIHPTPEWVPADPDLDRVPANEGSVALLLSGGPCRALLTGDLGAPAERHLVATLGDSLSAELLHVGHHGSRGSSTRTFLDRVRPRHAVASVGRSNGYGHPHPDALDRIAATGAVLHRTDRDGTVVARCASGGWRVDEARP